MSEYPFTVRPLSAQEGGGYLIEFPDLPGCMSDGDTVEEAIRSGEEAKRDWIAAMEEAGRPILPPSLEAPDDYSGKWQLRAPKSLHRRLAEHAKREGVSLNTLAVTLLAEGLGARTVYSRALQHATEDVLRSAAKTGRRRQEPAPPPHGRRARIALE